MQGSCRIAYPAGIETHVDDRLLDFRQAPPIAVVEQETALNTEGVLTEVALGTPSCFAAFNDLITLTVRAADRDECHGPFLPKRGYENEAQCDSNLSPSPLLKHYQIIQALRPAAHECAQYDRGVLVKGRAEHRRHRQDDMAIDHALVEDPAHLA